MPKLKYTLSYDGFGLNLTSQEYSPRIATFERGITALEQAEWDKLGPLLAAAPILLQSLESARLTMHTAGLPVAHLDRAIALARKGGI